MRQTRTLLLFAALLAALSSSSCQLVLPLHEAPPVAEDASVADGAALDEAAATACDGATAPYADEVTADQPAAYLRLGETAGPRAVDEMAHFSGQYADTGLTYGQPGAIAGDANTAVRFDGWNGIVMPPGLDFAASAPFTVELWAKPEMYLQNGFTIDHVNWTNGADRRTGWNLLLEPSDITLERWNEGTTDGSVIGSAPGLTIGTYHYVVVTFDGSRLTLYIDGESRASKVAPFSMGAAGASWTIATQNCPCSPNGFVGTLDEVAIYPSALTSNRITAHYCAATRH